MHEQSAQNKARRVSLRRKLERVAGVMISHQLTRFDDKGEAVVPKGTNLTGWTEGEFARRLAVTPPIA